MKGGGSAPILRVVRAPEDPPESRSEQRVPTPPEGDAGVDRSLDALYERYAPYIAAIATRILGRESEIEDVVQDVFASAVRGLRRREDDREIKSWLATVTVRRSMQQLRSRRFWALFDLADEPSYELLADRSAGPEERQLVAEVYRALDALPVRHRVPWTLRYVEGESLEQIAALCGCSLATAKRRISRAHERICSKLRGVGP